MQLTRLDRWLQETFVHEIHVYSLRPPEVLPHGVKGKELPDAPGRQYKHEFIARDSKAADALIEQFKKNNQMFTTRIVDRNAWYVPLIAPKGKSITWWCIWVVLIVVGLFVAATYINSLWSDPQFRKNFWEAFDIMQG